MTLIIELTPAGGIREREARVEQHQIRIGDPVEESLGRDEVRFGHGIVQDRSRSSRRSIAAVAPGPFVL
jgi:hypothetical protein